MRLSAAMFCVFLFSVPWVAGAAAQEIAGTQAVFVNGVRLEEPYINEPCDASHCPDGSWQLGPEQYFVMGDNRNHSRDSRSFGPVLRDHLIGEVLVRYWPLPDVGVVEAVGFPRS